MGGIGKRASSSLPKQFHLLGNLPIYQRTLRTFLASGIFKEIVVVSHKDWVAKVQEEVSEFSIVKVVAGGDTRQGSSLKGLEACSSSCDYVMIHDAVRPFVTLEILRRNAEAVLELGAVDTCIVSADTLVVTKDGKCIDSIPQRAQFRRGQTPQTFAYPLIWKAHKQASQESASDDCQLVLDLGVSVAFVEGSEENFKITTEWDLKIAQFKEKEARAGPHMSK